MRQTRKSDLFKALPIVAASLGRKFGVRVLFKGSTAMTDGKTIILPTLTEDSEHVDAMWGYLAHEAAHVRFTDFDLLEQQGKRNALEKNIHNILEDGVIEREMMKVFPGTVSSLRDTCQHLIDLKLWMDADDYDAKGEPTPPEHTLSGYILFRIRCDRGLSDQADLLQGYLDRFKNRFEATFGADVLDGLDSILDRAHLNADTRDAIAMTKEIMDFLELSSEESEDSDSGDQQQPSGQDADGQQGDAPQSGDSQDEEQTSQGGDSDDGDSSESSDSSDSGEASDQSDDANSGEDTGGSSSSSKGDGDDGAPDSTEQPGSAGADGEKGNLDDTTGSGNDSVSNEQEPASSEGGDSPAEQGGPSPSQRDSLRDAMASEDESAMAGDVLKPLAEAMEQEAQEKASDVLSVSKQTSQVAASYGVAPDEAIDYAAEGSALDLEARRVTRKLRQQLTGLVQASRTARPFVARRGRKLNASRLSRLKTGDTRVFAREDVTREPETAIHLLVDRSSSMAGIKATMAGQATYALAIALQSIEGVQVSASSFGGTPIQSPTQAVAENPVKTILSPAQVARRVPGRFVIQPEGLTPLAPGVWSALEAFRQANAERNVLIVLTDGAASDYVPAAHVIDRGRRQGIEVYGIGIQALANPELFDDSVLITELSQLGPELFQLARKRLIAA